ncbi:MAG: uracil-DNA glycosylase [Bacillales bacterium]|nr:uracil-DNA glycosylase [Bacillales bacterium]
MQCTISKNSKITNKQIGFNISFSFFLRLMYCTMTLNIFWEVIKVDNQMLKNDWQAILFEEFNKPYFINLRTFLNVEYERQTIYPQEEEIFSALHYTPYEEVKVVLLGQDPYHGPGQAHGLSFSVKPGIALPPSLKNIYKELKNDIGCPIPNNGYLKSWSDQGVLLLNTTLTVRAGEAASHFNKGWEIFTDRVIESLNKKRTPIVFLLWGKSAKAKKNLIDMEKHYIIETVHPSPLSAHRGFFGSKPFTKVNEILQTTGQQPIDWEIK